MGFDDIVYDTNLEEKILQPFKDDPELLTKYSGAGDMILSCIILQKWEEDNCYNGYSLAYHLLYQIRWVKSQGSQPYPLRTHEIIWCKLRCREEICKMMHEYYESIKDTLEYKLVEDVHYFYLGELIRISSHMESHIRPYMDHLMDTYQAINSACHLAVPSKTFNLNQFMTDALAYKKDP
jgi:hypothetical protein